VILALTANQYYTLRGARPGRRLSTVAGRLHLGRPFHLARNYWYLIPGNASTGVLKVRRGLIEEVGIANKRLTRGRAAQLRLLTSFNAQ
jgi:hypothetical protein